MSAPFFIVATLLTLLSVGVLVWTFRSGPATRPRARGLAALHRAPRHQRNMRQVRQALDPNDLRYAASQGTSAIADRMRRERKRVIYLYLDAIRDDFDQALRVARVIAALSPEVSGAQEYQRLKLALVFQWKLRLVKLRLALGIFSPIQLAGLGEMAASLALQMEEAMRQLGERAALAAELALQTER